MGCIQDIQCGKRVIIGIRDYGDCFNPESNLFINDHAGITIKSAAAIASEEHKSGYEMLMSFTKRAPMLVFEEFYAKASSFFRFNAIAETRKLNYWNGSILPAVNLERGILLKRWRSETAQIFVSELYIKAANTGTATVKIYDGDFTKTYSVDLTAGEEKTLRVDYLAKAEQIKILIDNASFQMYSGPIPAEYTGCNSCSGSAGEQGLWFSGWNGTSEQANYFGIGALASVRCYEENVLCQLIPRMYFLIWYKVGIMYWEELISSNRLNPITMYTKETAQANLDALQQKYDKAFENFIPTIKNFILSLKGDCFTCNSSIRYANSVRV